MNTNIKRRNSNRNWKTAGRQLPLPKRKEDMTEKYEVWCQEIIVFKYIYI